MNLSATIECRPLISPALLLGPLLDHIAAGVEVVHLKATDQCDSGFLKAAMCSNREEPHIEGALDASPAHHHEILINLRATGAPVHGRGDVHDATCGVAG